MLCLNPSAAPGPRARPRRTGCCAQRFRAAAAVETQALRARGARVRHIGPSGDAAELMGPNFMDASRAERVHHAGYRQGIALGRGER